ncbi:hypothetical protein GCM10027265_01430 [Jatrophihabitans fulvus]
MTALDDAARLEFVESTADGHPGDSAADGELALARQHGSRAQLLGELADVLLDLIGTQRHATGIDLYGEMSK